MQRSANTHTYTRGHLANATWTYTIKEVAPIVHPDVSKPCVVVVNNVTGTAGKRVWRRLAKHVANVRARYDQQRATARPHLAPSHGTITSLNTALFCYFMLKTDLCYRFSFKFRSIANVDTAENFTQAWCILP